ncbi:MAG: aminotransferase class V-fold PLP-dependent enzyme [bacterium]
MVDRKYPVDKELFYLDKNLIYLNHGSFGATPKAVLQRFIELTEQIDKNPMKFYLEDYPVLMDESRKAISSFLNVEPDNLAFVDNATTGVNAVLFSLINELNNESEILTASHYYPAVKNTLNHINTITGCKIKVADLPDYVESEEQIKKIILSEITSKTKLLVIDHITSISGLIIPINEIVQHCKTKGILTLIDGAHAPGSVSLDLSELNADWYTSNLHKWFFAPKGTAILYSSDTQKVPIHPTVISNDFGKGFTKEFDWVGTRNFCSWLTAPECLKFYKENFNYNYCRELSLFARHLIINKLGLEPMAHENLTGLMQSFWLPTSAGTTIDDVVELRNKLLNKYKIEVFMNPFKDRLVLRISSQIYNREEEYSTLINALKNEL